MSRRQGRAPSFQFYPSDWLTNTELRSCSAEARALWIDMMCHMHQSERYGYLQIGGKAIDAKVLAGLVNMHTRTVKRLLNELETRKVFEKNAESIVFSPRMERDNARKEQARKDGKLGGNPHLVGQKTLDSSHSREYGRGKRVNPPVNGRDKPRVVELAQSSSSSSSSPSGKDINTCPEPGGPVAGLAPLIILPCRRTKGRSETEYPVQQAELDEWLEIWKGTALGTPEALLRELRKVKRWLQNNPQKKKTYARMPQFFDSWFERTHHKTASSGSSNAGANGNGRDIYRKL